MYCAKLTICTQIAIFIRRNFQEQKFTDLQHMFLFSSNLCSFFVEKIFPELCDLMTHVVKSHQKSGVKWPFSQRYR